MIRVVRELMSRAERLPAQLRSEPGRHFVLTHADDGATLGRLPSLPSLTTLAALAVVATGNLFWGTDEDWKTVRSAILFCACLVILVFRAQIGREMARSAAAVSEGWLKSNEAPGAAMSPMTSGMIGVLLFFVVVVGELVPEEHLPVSHMRLILLVPASILLLHDWHRARQALLLKSASRSAGLSMTHGRFALESLLFRGVSMAVWALAVLAIGNAWWGYDHPWGTLRPVLYCAFFFAVLWEMHGGIGDVLSHLANTEVAERRRVDSLSRGWAVETDAARDQSWATQAILDALDLEPGLRVADVGGGGGYFAMKIASRVGSTGSLIATDVSPSLVTRLREQAQRRGLMNVQVHLVDQKQPLPIFEQVDRVLLANVYLFRAADESHGRAMIEHFGRALRPGGRLVLYNEFVHEAGWIASPEWPPLAAAEADPNTLIQWSAQWFDHVARMTPPPPPPDRPYAAHEQPGYLLVLKRHS